MWGRWLHWACPVAWTVYGLVASQYKGANHQLDTKQSVQEFLRSYFGFRQDFVGEVAAVVVGFAAAFALIFAFSIKALNFQRR